MKTLTRTVVSGMFILLIAAFTAGASKPRTTKRAAKPRVINITAVVDSALIMADDYTTSLTQKPEFAQTRLNILKSYYKSLPTDAVRDSVSSRIFDYYVNYVEKGQKEQADGFKNCFLAIVPDTNEHLGPLYANELILARESFDTIALENNINRLEAYANRMNYDYDEEINNARRFLNHLRTRPHINDILPGVWVSEDICEIKDEFNGVQDEESMIEGLAILRIRNFNKIQSLNGNQSDKNALIIPGIDSLNYALMLNGATSGYNLDAVKIKWRLTHCFSVLGSQNGYVPSPVTEAALSNIQAPLIDKPMYYNDAFRTMLDKDYYSRNMQTDNDAYAAYIYWGDEKLKVPQPVIGAIIRQSTQTTQAFVVGELSRSKYSFGESLAGNLAAGLVSAGINALVDALMVSTEKVWGIHVVVQVVNPYKLHAQVFAQLIKTKSNSNKIEDIRLVHEFDYYRWEPQDSIFFLGRIGYGEDVLALHAISKKEENLYKNQAKTEKQNYEAEWEKRIKEMPKGEERKSAEKSFKSYKKNGQFWKVWNKRALDKLKAKSDKYEQENMY